MLYVFLTDFCVMVYTISISVLCTFFTRTSHTAFQSFVHNSLLVRLEDGVQYKTTIGNASLSASLGKRASRNRTVCVCTHSCCLLADFLRSHGLSLRSQIERSQNNAAAEECKLRQFSSMLGTCSISVASSATIFDKF